MIIDAGYTKPIPNVTVVNRDELIHCIKMHNCILKIKAELDQLRSGLCLLGVWEAMSSHPVLLAPMFVAGTLTSGIYIYHLL